MTVKSIKYRLIRWKEFFEAFNHDAPFIVQEIADLFVEPYVYNCQETPTKLLQMASGLKFLHGCEK